MKKYHVIMTGICSLALVFGLTLMACENDSGGGGLGAFADQVTGRGGGSSNTIPAVPTDLVTLVASQSSITIRWSLVSGASGYRVYRAEHTEGSYNLLGETNNASYTDSGLSPNIPYYYKVRAYNSAGEGTLSSSVNAVITQGENSQGSAPSAPTNVTATRISPDQVNVIWNPVAGATFYFVYWALEAAGPYEYEAKVSTPSHTSKNWTDYDQGYFKVSAFNAAGEGPQSDYARVGAYTGGGNSGSPPSVPYNVTASASSASSITLSWSPVSGASGYWIYRKMKDDSYESFLTSASDTTYTDTGLYQGTTYYYTIVAYNEYGESSKSTAASATTLAGTPSAPSIHASAGSSDQITVSWNQVYGATNYKIYRSQANIYYTLIDTVSASSASYTDTGLSSNTTYYYKVSAVNSAGTEGSQSSYAYATTWSSSGSSGSVLPAPTGVWAYGISSDEVYVSWNPVSGATSYIIYWATSSSGTYYYDHKVEGTSFTSTGWDGISTAYFKVTAVNAAGVESEQSAYASASLPYYSVGTVPPAQKKLATQQMR
ncbi:MAG: fibronectin type III domain-containing protein [Treponema sp.]|jgi:fibronectin type 3 domain-containing protein|nr:fibronectin type III domain-containing protein [Treponema sp.]